MKNKNSLAKEIVLAVTYQCNSRCSFCNIWKSKKTYSLKPTSYKNLPHNLKSINISGGEPFLRNDLPQVIRVISRQCPKAKIVISTNGFLPSVIKRQISEIIKFKRDIGVVVSLDGFGKAHEDIRGFNGGFCLALDTIRLLKELGVESVKVGFTLGDQNIDQLKKVYRLSRELDVELSLTVVHNSEHFFQKADNEINNINRMKKELNWLIVQELKDFSPKRWLRAYFAWGAIKFLETGKRMLPDDTGVKSLFIDPFGNIYPSNVWGLNMGSLEKIKSWSDFSKKSKNLVDKNVDQRPESWMICTARQAIRKNWFKAGLWIFKTKFLTSKPKQYLICHQYARV